jgi:CheY-like chemotaxis protein
VKRLALFHHDPLRDDDALARLEEDCRRRATAHSHGTLEVFAAAEGQRIELPERTTGSRAPAAAAVNPTAADSRPDRTSPAARPAVLVADDDNAVRTVLEMVLRQDGCDVVCVANGAEAVAASKQRDFALVLLDVQMPEMDGYEACRTLRADPRLKDVPIVMLTALSDHADVQAGFAQGATDHMAKPVVPGQIRARVRTWLSRAAQPAG